MKSRVLLLALILHCEYGSSSRSTGLRFQKIKGNEPQGKNRNLELILPERKNPPENHAAKMSFKMSRTSVLTVPTAALVPTASPTASRKERNPTPSPTASTKAPTESPSRHPTNSPTISPTKVPTRKPTPEPTRSPTRKPTPQPIRLPTDQLTIIGDGGNPGHVFPLAQCEGDCDSDNDCLGNLICIQREGTSSIPGCEGKGERGKDYCTNPSLALGDPNYRFQLRLYWHQNFFWQETHEETWWCMECTKCDEYSLGDGPNHGCVVPGSAGSSCQEGHMIWIRRCKDDRRLYEFNILKNSGSGDQVRVDGTNLCLSTVDNRYLELKKCNKDSSRQIFKPVTNLSKFELLPYYQRNWSISNARCLSQLHHPKDKELVGLHQCETARNHQTLYWEEYLR